MFKSFHRIHYKRIILLDIMVRMMSYTYSVTQLGRYVYSTHTLRNNELVNLGYELDKRSYAFLEKLHARSKRGYLLYYYNERPVELYVSRVQSILEDLGWDPVIADTALRIANNYGYLTQMNGRGYDPLALAAATVFYAYALCAARAMCRQYPRATLFWTYSSRPSFYRALRILLSEIGFTNEAYKMILRGYRILEQRMLRVFKRGGSSGVDVYVADPRIQRIFTWIDVDVLVVDLEPYRRRIHLTLPKALVGSTVFVEMISASPVTG